MAGVSVGKNGKKWRYRFDGAVVDGKRTVIQKSGFDTKREALAAGNEALAKYSSGGVAIQRSEMSYADVIDKWMEGYCKVNLKSETIVDYNKKINRHIKPHLGKFKVGSISSATLQEFINDVFNRGYSRNTLVCIKGIITSSMRYASDVLKVIQVSPADHIRMPSYRAKAEVPTRSDPHVYIPADKMDEILGEFPEGTSSHLPLQLGYHCGLRLGEAYAVTWDDVDFEKKTLRIDRQVQWDKQRAKWYVSDPKYGSNRTIDLDDEMLGLLSRTKTKQEKFEDCFGAEYTYLYLDEYDCIVAEPTDRPLNLINVRNNGTYIQPRTMQHASSVIHNKLHYKNFDYHSLRHTHATVLVEQGVPIKFIQARLGHKSPLVTMKIYEHLTEELQRQSITKLNDIYAKK